jgi:hypothetical protein
LASTPTCMLNSRLLVKAVTFHTFGPGPCTSPATFGVNVLQSVHLQAGRNHPEVQ